MVDADRQDEGCESGVRRSAPAPVTCFCCGSSKAAWEFGSEAQTAFPTCLSCVSLVAKDHRAKRRLASDIIRAAEAGALDLVEAETQSGLQRRTLEREARGSGIALCPPAPGEDVGSTDCFWQLAASLVLSYFDMPRTHAETVGDFDARYSYSSEVVRSLLCWCEREGLLVARRVSETAWLWFRTGVQIPIVEWDWPVGQRPAENLAATNPVARTQSRIAKGELRPMIREHVEALRQDYLSAGEEVEATRWQVETAKSNLDMFTAKWHRARTRQSAYRECLALMGDDVSELDINPADLIREETRLDTGHVPAASDTIPPPPSAPTSRPIYSPTESAPASDEVVVGVDTAVDGTDAAVQTPAEERRTRTPISDYELRAVTNWVESNPGQTAGQIAQGVNAGTERVPVILAALRKSGAIRTEGQKRGTRYFPPFPPPRSLDLDEPEAPAATDSADGVADEATQTDKAVL